ncbi:acyl-CoA thioester hydrolase [Salsuginibacillus halophilus]|uniref:Acyl-CoA thioester hydrolase n=1 Tax=Salsuginibacillus halophilus TaxID=517424 RepID=A0A2P8HI61_9BACI|nr:acyl-CoA thioester hydrolase [Salsuginibacillus halophilus]
MGNALYTRTVPNSWTDYNGHMNDAAYAAAFSHAGEALIERIGLDADGRSRHGYTIFTLETHIVYLNEVHEEEEISISVQFLDYDQKRLHLFYTMYNASGERAAVSEQMFMGMDTATEHPAPFPEPVYAEVEMLAASDKNLERPHEAGRTIGIRRKG